jgi:hypothetical protein
VVEKLPTLFDRIKAEPDPVPPGLDAVRRSRRRLRTQRRLTALAAAACAVALVAGIATGVRTGWLGHRTSVPASPSPTGTPGGPPDFSGFLRPADLGADRQWKAGGDQWTTTSLDTDAPAASEPIQLTYRCRGDQDAVVPGGAARSREYLSRIDAGFGIWPVSETVTDLDTDAARTLRSAVNGLRECPLERGDQNSDRVTVLAHGDGLLVVGRLLPDGLIGSAEAYLVTDRAFVELSTSPGQIDGEPLPGQAGWLTEVARTAVQRITGTRPPALTVHAGIPTGGGTPAPVDPPATFLSRQDLGTVGHWQRATTRQHTSSPATSVPLPLCAGDPRGQQPPEVAGPGGVQSYLGWSGDSDPDAVPATGPYAFPDAHWSLRETVITLDAAGAATVRAQLTAAAGCAQLDAARIGHVPIRRIASPTGTVAMAEDRSGFLLVGEAWALSGTTLVWLHTDADGRAPGAAGAAAVPTSWLTDVLDAATRRATGG